jgi:hypothetical protein
MVFQAFFATKLPQNQFCPDKRQQKVNNLDRIKIRAARFLPSGPKVLGYAHPQLFGWNQ